MGYNIEEEYIPQETLRMNRLRSAIDASVLGGYPATRNTMEGWLRLDLGDDRYIEARWCDTHWEIYAGNDSGGRHVGETEIEGVLQEIEAVALMAEGAGT